MRAALVLLAAALSSQEASASPDWCAQLEAQPTAPYLVREVDGNWQLLARRPLTENARAALASAKASLAGHITGKSGSTVSWSGATSSAPVGCGKFQAVLLTVPVATVRLGQQIEPLELDEAEVARLMERRLQGSASAAELLRLAGYYQLAGDSAEAARLAAQARENSND